MRCTTASPSFAGARRESAPVRPGFYGPSRWLPRWWCSSSSADRCWTVWARRVRRRWPQSAGMVRWSVEAQTAWLPAMAAIQPLHGLTFALLHLANMRVLAETVPPRLAATALTLYGTVGVGAAVALLTLASGWLYAQFGAQGFWVMAVLCAAALPLARKLREG